MIADVIQIENWWGQSQLVYYALGVIVVTLVIFSTSARTPNPQCPRCQKINRPMARYCAHCGRKLDGQ